MKVKKFGEIYEAIQVSGNTQTTNNVQSDSPVSEKAIMFTDVVGSSAKWAEDPETMKEQLDKHFNTINNIAKKWSGFVVKTIGDAFMIYFKESDKTLFNAVNCAIEVLNTEQLPLRIGICSGDMEEKTYILQDANLKDYFGNAVNTASRMESKVAEPGGIAFTYTNNISKTESTSIVNLIEKYKPIATKYSNDCNSDKEMQGKRSGRLLTDIHLAACKSVQELKGVKELTAFSFKVKQ
ncbi:adenylate/guanylate cyclase domain-containing protein [bacterium]|jgi:hypothetical protein|nr:adenylate/guanylate cyclase domain-containing protein [bacterium]